MACACKAKKSGQVTAVKQVIKKSNLSSAVKPSQKPTMKHIVVKRPY